VVFARFSSLPWTQDAALVPGSFVFAAHFQGTADWAGASAAHGRPYIVGELPEGIDLLDKATGALSPEAQALLDVCTDLATGGAPAGVRPAGSKTDYVANQSTAWQVFKELLINRESSAMRIYLGTDALLGSRGNAPGVDLASLFAVASTRIQADLTALETGFREGVIQPWLRAHGAPNAEVYLEYQLPDPDAAARAEQEATAVDRLKVAVESLKSIGCVTDQAVIDALVEAFGVTVPVVLANTETKRVPLDLAPTDVPVTPGDPNQGQGQAPNQTPADQNPGSDQPAANETPA
jgi:hypothetical protein